jgi:PAS domain S-box-containing protein
MLFDTNLRYVLVRGQAPGNHTLRPADFEGRPISEVLAPERWALYEPLYRAALKGETCSTEVPSVDGGNRIYLIRVGPLRADSGKIIGGVSTATEITERRRIEQALAESEE